MEMSKNFSIVLSWNRKRSHYSVTNEDMASLHSVRITEKVGGENGENCIWNGTVPH